MASASSSKESIKSLDTIVDNMLRALTKTEPLQREVAIQLRFRFVSIQNTFELEARSSDRTQFADFFPSAGIVHHQHDIVPRMCKKLITDGYNVTDANEPPVFAHSTTAAAQTGAKASVELDAAAAAVAISVPLEPSTQAATRAVSELMFPSVASVFARDDARAKAHAARRKAEKEAFDHETLQYLHRRIEDGDDLGFIQSGHKRGYSLRVYPPIDIGGKQRTRQNFRNVLPLLQDAIRPTEKVTCDDDVLGLHITVMEI